MHLTHDGLAMEAMYKLTIKGEREFSPIFEGNMGIRIKKYIDGKGLMTFIRDYVIHDHHGSGHVTVALTTYTPEMAVELYNEVTEVLLKGEYTVVEHVYDGLCQIRRDLLEDGMSVPAGSWDIDMPYEIPYQWRPSSDPDERHERSFDEFYVLVYGTWVDAVSIDFEFKDGGRP